MPTRREPYLLSANATLHERHYRLGQGGWGASSKCGHVRVSGRGVTVLDADEAHAAVKSGMKICRTCKPSIALEADR